MKGKWNNHLSEKAELCYTEKENKIQVYPVYKKQTLAIKM
jgi:hypothetical protein